MKRTPPAFVAYATCAAVLLGSFACSSTETTPGELILSFQTDMRLPEDTDHVRIVVTRFGKAEFDQTYEVGPNGTAKIPATLGVLAGSNPADPIKVSVIALLKNTPQVLREATTTIPKDRVATLRMPIQWLCYGPRSVTGGTPEKPVSACAEDQTCVAGACQTQAVDSALLPDFNAGDIFGGGSGDGDGSCFDTDVYLPAGLTPLSPTLNAAGLCVVPKPSGDEAKINVGIRLRETTSTCPQGGCVVPFDLDPEAGWRIEGANIVVPKKTCELFETGKLDVIASVGVPSKTLSVPMCGPGSATNTPSAPGVSVEDAADSVPNSSGDAGVDEGGVVPREAFVSGISMPVASIAVITTGAGPNLFYRTAEGLSVVEIATGQPALVPLSKGVTRMAATDQRLTYQTVDDMGVFSFLYSVAVSNPTKNDGSIYGPQSDLQFLTAADDGTDTQAYWFLGNTLQGCLVSDCLGSMGALASAATPALDLAASSSRLAWVQGSGESGVVRLCPRPAGNLMFGMCETDQADTAIGQYVPESLRLTATHAFFRTADPGTGLQWCSVSGCNASLVRTADFPDYIAPISTGVLVAKGANVGFYDLAKTYTAIATAVSNVTALYADESYVYYATSSDAYGNQIWKVPHYKGNP